MAKTTKNLGLALLGVTAEDKSVTFEEWRTSINGENESSNMNLIDVAIGTDRSRLEEIENIIEELQNAQADSAILGEGISISTGSDLNTIISSGVYVSESDDVSKTLMNTPTDIAFRMIVTQAHSFNAVSQIIVSSDNHLYIRSFANNAWSDWAYIYTTTQKPNYDDQYADINHKHDEYATVDHTHKPQDIGAANASHKHDFTDMSGVLGVDRGGTGATEASVARVILGITPSNIGAAEEDHDHALTDMTGVLDIGHGGTGSNTAASARAALEITPANIGAAEKNHDHSIVDLTGTLSIEHGGTGSVNASSARAALGITPSNIGAAEADHDHMYPVNSVAGKTGDVQLLPEDCGVIYSHTEPTGARGMVWLSDANTGSDIVSLIYSIGSVYTTSTNVSPAKYFGGTWTLIEKKCSDKYWSYEHDTLDGISACEILTDSNGLQAPETLRMVRRDNVIYLYFCGLFNISKGSWQLNLDFLGVSSLQYSSGVMTDASTGTIQVYEVDESGLISFYNSGGYPKVQLTLICAS